jgi:uncharacterized tellurite resistance protein B-like protein
MFERLTALFRTRPPAQAPLPELDAKYALGTLLVRVAKADSSYLFEEIEQIDRVLARLNGLNPVEAAKMRAMCERLAQHVGDNAALADLIRDHVDYAHRKEAMTALWAVARADGITDDREAELVDLVETHLGVDREESEATRAATVIP